MMDRRMVLQMTASASLIGGLSMATGASAQNSAPAKVEPASIPPSWMGKEQIAILIYDGMTSLDIVGPHFFLSSLAGATVHLVARSLKPVTGDGLTITPTTTFGSCPRDLDVLLTGGGTDGTLNAMEDPATLAFLADRGARAKWVASVCTGSLLLARAGLLKGYKATSHWIGRPMLQKFGAIEVDERVVFDRNRATGAGVSAGLDLGLALVQRLRPLDFAQTVQLFAEYAPEPPLDSGTPDRAPAQVLAHARETLQPFVDAVSKMEALR